MGWKSSVELTREDAIQKLQNTNWEEFTNDELVLALDGAFGEKCGTNYAVYDSLETT